MALNGYIKLHRKMLYWQWYGDPAVKAVWLHLLLTANRADEEKDGKVIKRGQTVVGSVSTARILGISRQQFRTAICKLQATREITIQSTKRYSIVTIVKYDDYQIFLEEPTKDTTSKASTAQPRYGEDKKYKNNIPPIVPHEKSDAFASYAGDNAELLEALRDFEAMRRQQKKPMTDRAQKMLLGKLDELSGQDARLKVKLLEQSILNCWSSVYPLKDDPAESGKRKPKFLN